MDWELELGGAPGAAGVLAVISAVAFLLLLALCTRRSRRSEFETKTMQAGELHAAMVRLHHELPHLFESMTDRVDAKMHALREMIHEAGMTIELLRRLKTSSDAEPNANQRASTSPPHPPEPTPDDRARSPAAEPRRTTRRTTCEKQPADPTELRSERYAHVYSLADAGHNPAEISTETGMHRGEVELVLSLRRARVRLDRENHPGPTRVKSTVEEATV